MENNNIEMELMQGKLQELIDSNQEILEQINSLFSEVDYLNRNFNTSDREYY